MEEARTPPPEVEALQERRPTGGGQPGSLRGNPAGPPDGRPVARSAGGLRPQPGDVLAPPQPMGGRRRLGGRRAGVPEAARRPRPPGMAGVLHRRHVHAGQKGGPAVGKTRKGNGTKCMAVAGGTGVPISILAAPANPHESTLAERTLRGVRIPRPGRGRPRSKPPRLISDRTYDRGPLRERFRQRGIDLIAPHISGRAKTQDGRKLRRYRCLWIIERTNSWWNTSCRRPTTRWDRSLTAFLGFLPVAILMICLRRF